MTSLYSLSEKSCKSSPVLQKTSSYLLIKIALQTKFYYFIIIYYKVIINNIYSYKIKILPTEFLWQPIALLSLSRVWLFVTSWAAACQASLSFTISWNLLKLSPLSRWCHLTISSSVPLPSIFPSIRVFSNESVLRIRWQSIGASASASVPSINIQDWFPLGLTGLISLPSKGLSRVFSHTIIQRHQLFGAHISLWFNFHIHTWQLEKPQLWLDRPLSAK